MAKRKAPAARAAGSTRKKPASRKTREGNAGRRKSGTPVGAVKLTEAPECPQTLRDRGRELWQKLAQRLVELKLLTDLDTEALEILCDAWNDYHELAPLCHGDERWFVTDKGYVAEHPAVRMRQTAINTIAKCWRQFGLTPLTREGLDVDLSNEDDNDLLKFASRKPR